MRYRLDYCPICELRPIEEYDLPPVFPPEGRVPVICTHCGTRLTAILIGEASEGFRRVVFRPQRSGEASSQADAPRA